MMTTCSIGCGMEEIDSRCIRQILNTKIDVTKSFSPLKLMANCCAMKHENRECFFYQLCLLFFSYRVFGFTVVPQRLLPNAQKL